MKQRLLAAALLLPALLFSQAHEWARNTTTASYSIGNAVNADHFGNVYVTGFYGDINNNVPFDQVTGGGYIARYKSDGSFLWALPAGGQGMDVITDDSGYVYVTGSYSETSPILDTLIYAHHPFGQDQFILKMDSLGNRIWVRGFGANSIEYSGGIAIDATGNLYVCGSFSDSLWCDDTLRALALGASGQRDIYVVAYENDGDYRWTTRAGGNVHDESTGIDCDAAGNVYITGSVRGPAMIGSTSITTYLGIADIYCAKLNAAGTFLWAQSWGSNYTEYGGGLYVDNNNCVWITGRYYDNNIFISKYTAGGNFVFNETPTSGVFSGGEDISGDDMGHIYMNGYFGAFATFGTTTLNTAGARDVFMAAYDSLGNHNWAIRAGGTDIDDPKRIFADQNGNIYHTGYFTAKAGFNFDTLYALDTLYNDMFLAKLNTAIITSGNFVEPQTAQLTVYPNPVTGVAMIIVSDAQGVLTVTDAAGRVISAERIASQNGVVRYSVAGLSAGVYLVQWISGDEQKVTRMVVE